MYGMMNFTGGNTAVMSILYATVYKLLYYINIGAAWLLDFVYRIFDTFGGVSKTAYDGDGEVLLGVFFSNGFVSYLIWAMAIINVLTTLGLFAFLGVRSIRGRKLRYPGKVVWLAMSKTVCLLLAASFVLAIVLNATGILTQQVKFACIEEEYFREQPVEFTDEEYAAMARTLNTIGNYSLNPTYNNRYNINSCFNEIRSDLQYLAERGVFEHDYSDADMTTWQVALCNVASSASLSEDLMIDVHYEEVSDALIETMELLRIDGSFQPLETFSDCEKRLSGGFPLDRTMFLFSTLHASKNLELNTNPHLTDAMRSDYYYGEKSIYDLDAVNEDFDIGTAAFAFVIMILATAMLLKYLLVILFNGAVRFFNLLMIYFLAIPIASNENTKLKKLAASFAVNALAVVASVVLMRVLLILLPAILTADIQIAAHPLINVVTKLLLLLVVFAIGEKLSQMIADKLAVREGIESLHAPQFTVGKQTHLVTVIGAGKNLKTMMMNVIHAYVVAEEQTSEIAEETPIDIELPERFKSWGNKTE